MVGFHGNQKTLVLMSSNFSDPQCGLTQMTAALAWIKLPLLLFCLIFVFVMFCFSSMN